MTLCDFRCSKRWTYVQSVTLRRGSYFLHMIQVSILQPTYVKEVRNVHSWVLIFTKYRTPRPIIQFRKTAFVLYKWNIAGDYPEPLDSTLTHSLRSILILSSHLRLGLPSSLFPPGFSTKFLCGSSRLPMRTTCPAHLTLLNLKILISNEECKLWISSLCSLLQLLRSSQVKIVLSPSCQTASM
jgi:hypothetical protein